MKKDKSDVQKYFDNLKTYVEIYNGSEPEYAGDVPKKQRLYFGCNSKSIPTIIISWKEKGRGFGQYCFQIIDGKMVCHSESDSKETVKRILCEMVDQCEFIN